MIFYKALYASPNINSEQSETMLQEPWLPKLSQEEQHKCEGLVTYEECKNALKSMSIGKSPGCDGLNTDFFFNVAIGRSFIKIWRIVTITKTGGHNLTPEKKRRPKDYKKPTTNVPHQY